MTSFDQVLAWVSELEDLMGIELFVLEFVGNMKKWNTFKVMCGINSCPFSLQITYRQQLNNDLKLSEVFELEGNNLKTVVHWHGKDERYAAYDQDVKEFGKKYKTSLYKPKKKRYR